MTDMVKYMKWLQTEEKAGHLNYPLEELVAALRHCVKEGYFETAYFLIEYHEWAIPVGNTKERFTWEASIQEVARRGPQAVLQQFVDILEQEVEQFEDRK